MIFEFTPITKNRFFEGYMPDDIIRVSAKKGISFNRSVGSKLGTIHQSENGAKYFKVTLDWDARNQALRITGSDTGFRVTTNESLGGSFRAPVGLIRAGLLTGDYVLVEGERNIFKLA